MSTEITPGMKVAYRSRPDGLIGKVQYLAMEPSLVAYVLPTGNKFSCFIISVNDLCEHDPIVPIETQIARLKTKRDELEKNRVNLCRKQQKVILELQDLLKNQKESKDAN